MFEQFKSWAVGDNEKPKQFETESIEEGDFVGNRERTLLLDKLYSVVTNEAIKSLLDVELRFSGKENEQELADLIKAANLVVEKGWDRDMSGHRRAKALVAQISRLTPPDSQAA